MWDESKEPPADPYWPHGSTGPMSRCRNGQWCCCSSSQSACICCWLNDSGSTHRRFHNITIHHFDCNSSASYILYAYDVKILFLSIIWEKWAELYIRSNHYVKKFNQVESVIDMLLLCSSMLLPPSTEIWFHPSWIVLLLNSRPKSSFCSHSI